ncbi:hypothetical protein GT352_21530 [Streptomyces sp. SID1046]|uniref:hypothetical protein n=1 Tax=Streptomyces sp. SID1046 TaxID=2690249 RepID=UPI00136DA3CC|nr:hypothetical protein [Streptomyces sp. SID1046]
MRRTVQLLSDLDELSRLHAGALDLYLRPVDLDELLTAVLDDLGPGGHLIQCSLPEQLPDVIADAAVLTRVLTALAAESQRHSPPDSLTLRMCRDLTETMGGTLETAAAGPGFAVTLTLPAASRRPITPSTPSPTEDQ